MSTSTPRRWPVILSGRAIRELRYLGRDQKTLEVVRKKFHELSHGQFTSDNYLVVRGTSEHIPIYRARASIDLRIIYQVDLAADPLTEFDHQIIKIFTVSPRPQVSYDFWVKVSKYLAKQGPEYRNRCIVRTTLKESGTNTCVPEKFCHRQYNSMFIDNNYVFEGETDLNELHETLVLEKFTPITKSLYNSILADMEAVLPMALNPDEKRIVRHQGTCVVVGRSGTGKTTALIYKLRANAQAAATFGGDVPIRQLFVTRSPVLTRHIANNYHGLIESSEIANKTRQELTNLRRKNEHDQDRELVEYDNEVDLRRDLPDKFSLLKDSDFPLFLSFEKLCELLEADIAALRGDTLKAKISVIKFTDFKYSYWPKFNHALTRRLDPGLVFSEILGVIKGCGNDLSKEEYLSSLSRKKSPLLFDVRDRVYAIFEAYSKQARSRNQYDAADRTRMILDAHACNPLPGSSLVDYIFVDEVQDQLMLDVQLIQSLCSNRDGGYWCGDTAQTISVGSSFRIRDLKSFIYQDMLSYGKSSVRRQAAPFETFELSVNFRSHNGIVRYAASIVELVYTLFPNSIDRMEPETARTPGPVPLLFVSPTIDEDLFVEKLLGTEFSAGTTFGAHQAIIVRSRATATSLTNRLQKRCNILTLLDTKGLEFDDLIIYNFFSESEASTSCWRAMLALSGELKDGRINYDKRTVVPSTSPTLCSELKQLYVAVTRARHRCWLWDSGEIINLTKGFWANFNLIAISDSLEKVNSFAVSSKDLREWARRGRDFFSSGLYANAKMCFERAHHEKEAAIADAYEHMSQAKKTLKKEDYFKAGALMERCASRADVNDSNNVLWYHAATCFEAAGHISKASASYRCGFFYDRAVLVSFDNQNFDDTLLTLLPYSEHIDHATFERIRDVSRMHYLRASNYNKLRELFDNNQNACIKYARSSGFTAQLKDLLKESLRFEELANVHLEEGSPAEAMQCILQSTNNISTSFPRIEKIAWEYLWMNLGLDCKLDSATQEQALRIFKVLSPHQVMLDGTISFDLELFKTYLGGKGANLNVLEGLNLEKPELEPRAILACHQVLQGNNAWVHDAHYIFRYLEIWRIYARNVQMLAELANPVQDNRVRQLLGCSSPKKKPRTGNFVHVASSSLIYHSAKDMHTRINQTISRGENVIAAADANRIIALKLSEGLETRLMGLHHELKESPLLDYPSGLEVEMGISESAPSRLEISEKIRAVFIAADIFEMIRSRTAKSYSAGVDTSVRHAWVTRLFDLVNPSTGAINTLCSLPWHANNNKLGKRFQDWVHEYMLSLKPRGRDPLQFLSKFIIGASLSFELESLCGSSYPFPRHPQALIYRGCSVEPRSVIEDLSCLFLHEDHPRLLKCILALQWVVDKKLNIEASVLVHIIERITREVVLAERVATSSRLLSGIAGLVMPASWIRSLLSYTKLGKSTFDISPLQSFVATISEVIRMIQHRVPGYWQTSSTRLWKHSISSLSLRMYWCIALIIVNINPNHQALGQVLKALNQDDLDMTTRFECESLRYRSDVDARIERITASHDQPSCLAALVQTIRHEDLMLLVRDSDLCCPAKRRLISRVIEFDSLIDLRRKILGHLISPGPRLDFQPEAKAFPKPHLAEVSDSSPSPVCQARDGSNTDTTSNREEHAAKRIQRWWRRQLLMKSSDLGKEVQYYRHFNPFISQKSTGDSKRDRIFRVVFRGPVLLVLGALETLIEQLEEGLEATGDNLKTQGIDAKAIEVFQTRQKTLIRYRQATETLRLEISPDSPANVFKANNLMAIKSRLNQYSKTTLLDIAKLGYLDDSEAVDQAKEMFWCGLNAVRKTREV